MNQLTELGQVTQAMFQLKSAEFQQLVQRENEIRKALQDLTQRSTQARNQVAQDVALRAMRADLAWERWAAAKRADLNMSLARVLAQKEARKQSLKKAFGKDQVVKELKLQAFEALQLKNRRAEY